MGILSVALKKKGRPAGFLVVKNFRTECRQAGQEVRVLWTRGCEM